MHANTLGGIDGSLIGGRVPPATNRLLAPYVHPGSGSLVAVGTLVAGPSGGNPRFKLTIPVYTGYSYEIYGNPTLADLAWGALPFSLAQTDAIDRNIYTATSDGTLDLYLEAKSVKGFYYVSFRVPGANTGTPGTSGGGGPGMP